MGSSTTSSPFHSEVGVSLSRRKPHLTTFFRRIHSAHLAHSSIMTFFQSDLYTTTDDEDDKSIKNIITTALTQGTRVGTAQAGLQIDKCWDKCVASNPQAFADGFRAEIEDIIIYMASIIPHDSPAQDNLVDLVLALREIPFNHDLGRPKWTGMFLGDLPGNLHEAFNGT
jgi:hypothetical protein